MKFGTRSAVQQSVTTLLTEYGINYESWENVSSKNVQHLVDEVIEGETDLQVVEGKLVRLVNVVGVHITYTAVDGMIWSLIESHRLIKKADGEKVDYRKLPSGVAKTLGLPADTPMFVSEKMFPEEYPDDAVVRALAEEVGLSISTIPDFVNKYVVQKDSHSYPGLTARYQYYLYALELETEDLHEIRYVEVQKDKTTYFGWQVL